MTSHITVSSKSIRVTAGKAALAAIPICYQPGSKLF